MSLPTRYVGWMARDVVTGPGVPIAIMTTLATLLVSKLQASGPTGSADQAACLFVLDWTGVTLALMGTAGLVSADPTRVVSGPFVNVCPAVSYSPTQSPVQYHRR